MVENVRRRSVRVARVSPVAAKKKNLDKIKTALQEYAQQQEVIAAAVTKLQDMEVEITVSMIEHDVESVNAELVGGGFLCATYKEEFGNASHKVDPVAFYKAVPDKNEALAAMTVSKASAEKLLSGKQLAKITDSTEGASKGYKLSLSRKKKL